MIPVKDWLYWIWLTELGLGPTRVMEILDCFGSPKAAWEADSTAVQNSPLDGAARTAVLKKGLDSAKKLLENVERPGISILTIHDPGYPPLLAEIPDAPPILYIRGKLPDFEETMPLAMIGTRKPSVYASKMAQKFAFEIANGNMLVVSGMARGIDTLCHRGALSAGKKTVAVLGCGVDVVYPSENAEIKRIIEANGAVVSEYPPGTPPLAANFPNRNRIISGLCHGVFVVEGGARSGTMITVRTALEQGREVFTIPTNLDNKAGEGNLVLLQQGAKLVRTVTDIFEEFMLSYPEQAIQASVGKTTPNLPLDQKMVLELLHNSIPVHIDELCKRTSLPAAKVNGIITMLELNKMISRLPGKMFILS